MRPRFKLPLLVFVAGLLVVASGYVFILGAPERQARSIAELIRKRDWAGVYKSQTAWRFSTAWSEKTFVDFAKKYIEPNADFGDVDVTSFSSEVSYLDHYSISLGSRSPDGQRIFGMFIMPMTARTGFKVFGSQVAFRWDYLTTLSTSEAIQNVANVRYPDAVKTKHHIDDSAEYEFLLAEGDQLRKMGCEHFHLGSKRDDIAAHIDSIEEHARLYKTARYLVPIAAKYGRTMKWLPTAAELAMK